MMRMLTTSIEKEPNSEYTAGSKKVPIAPNQSQITCLTLGFNHMIQLQLNPINIK